MSMMKKLTLAAALAASLPHMGAAQSYDAHIQQVAAYANVKDMAGLRAYVAANPEVIAAGSPIRNVILRALATGTLPDMRVTPSAIGSINSMNSGFDNDDDSDRPPLAPIY